jgi:hypothetical protein
MAACFVCGLSLGIFAMRGRNEPLHSTGSIPGHEIAATTTADEPGIWSVRRFRDGWSSVTVKEGDRIMWKSPVRKPEMF